MFNKNSIVSANDSRKKSEEMANLKNLEREKLLKETFEKCLNTEKNELVHAINHAVKKGKTVEVCIIRNEYTDLVHADLSKLDKFYNELIKDFVEKGYEFERLSYYDDLQLKIKW